MAIIKNKSKSELIPKIGQKSIIMLPFMNTLFKLQHHDHWGKGSFF